jgi:inner membrane protein
MPTIMTHGMLGIAAASVVPYRKSREKVFAFSVLCSILPDADVVGFVFDVPYGHVFGHRGFFHSLCFAVAVTTVVVCVAFREERAGSKAWWGLMGYFFVLSASHGILDAFTAGGFGIALLSPFDNTRYRAWVTPFEAAPLDLAGFLTPWGLRVLKSEILWLWLPALALVWCCRRVRGRARPSAP